MAYTEPTPADLQARYSAFAAVADATINYWLTDAHRFVDQSWFEEDYAPALIAAAAHNMARARVSGLAEDLVGSIASTGATSFKSGTFSATFSESAAAQASAGGWGSTPYGMEYLDALYRNKSGFGTTSPGSVCCGGGYRDRPIP